MKKMIKKEFWFWIIIVVLAIITAIVLVDYIKLEENVGNQNQKGSLMLYYSDKEVYYSDDECEECFEEPIDIVWTGQIYGMMMSGDAYAIRRIPENEEHPNFMACCVDCVEKKECFTGKVRVTGKWLGTTCAYTNAFFGGKLVPNIEIEKIEKSKESQP